MSKIKDILNKAIDKLAKRTSPMVDDDRQYPKLDKFLALFIMLLILPFALYRIYRIDLTGIVIKINSADVLRKLAFLCTIFAPFLVIINFWVVHAIIIGAFLVSLTFGDTK